MLISIYQICNSGLVRVLIEWRRDRALDIQSQLMFHHVLQGRKEGKRWEGQRKEDALCQFRGERKRRRKHAALIVLFTPSALPSCSFVLSSKEQLERFRLSFFVSSFILSPPHLFLLYLLPSKHCNTFSATNNGHLGGRKGKPPVSPRKVVALY